MNPQPSAADVQNVANFMAGAPAQAPQQLPAQPQPTPPQAQQPAPQPVQAPQNPFYTPGIGSTPQQPQQQPAQQAQPGQPQQPADPFASMFNHDPSNPNTPNSQQPQQAQWNSQPQGQSTEVSQVGQPQAQPQQQPAQQAQPGQPQQPAAQPAAQPSQQSYEDYVNSILATIPAAPARPELKDINADDPASVEKFFSDFASTIREETLSSVRQENAVRDIEAKAWNEAFDKFPSLKSNKEARDIVQSIRVRNHQMGVYQSPTQAAESFLQAMGNQYRQGIADNQVHTTIQATQPNYGGGQPPAPVANSRDELLAVQDGGETALANILANRINNGQL